MANYSLRARDIMQVEVATILEDATIAEAALQMRLEGVRSLIIEPLNADDPFGIVTHSDMVTRVLAEGKDPALVQIHEIMIKPAVQIPPGMDVEHIARLFRQTGIGHAPVVESGKLLGIISMTDLVTEVITEPSA
ncbi:MAG: CBS domain-containing protein [Anaerolineae bacterium]|nr:CBS domain-containing protein [Anaerolineae bacterium]